jgi:tetratricopeptide (TPR) repeat protein
MQAIGYVWRRQGLYEEARSYLERATILDPRHFWYVLQLGITYTSLRQYEEAGRCYDRALELGPDNVSTCIHNSLNVLNWTGDLEQSRFALESSPEPSNPEIRVALYWQHLYERDIRGAIDQLAGLPDKIVFMSLSISSREQLAGYAYRLLDDPARARSSYRSALKVAEETAREQPEDGRAYGALGLVYAGLGRREDAIQAGKKGMELHANDALGLPLREWEMVQILLLLGEHDAAIDHIEHLLSVPSYISATFLEINPEVDALRDLSRFKRLVGGSGQK